MLSIFISGLVRQSGKTLLTAGLAGTMQSLCYSTSVYKPIQTGAVLLNNTVMSQDLQAIRNIDSNIRVSSVYAFQSPRTPLVAAYEENSKIDITVIHNEFQSNIQMTECHIVEGANSVFSPIDEHRTEADIIKMLGLPVLLVVNPKISSIGEVIAGVNFVLSNKVNLLGIVINDYDENSENLEEKYFPQLIKEYTNIEILGYLPHYDDMISLTPDTLIADILNRVDIEKIFALKIAKLNA